MRLRRPAEKHRDSKNEDAEDSGRWTWLRGWRKAALRQSLAPTKMNRNSSGLPGEIKADPENASRRVKANLRRHSSIWIERPDARDRHCVLVKMRVKLSIASRKS